MGAEKMHLNYALVKMRFIETVDAKRRIGCLIVGLAERVARRRIKYVSKINNKTKAKKEKMPLTQLRLPKRGERGVIYT